MATQYDKKATEAYLRESAFHVGGFMETFWSEGRLIGQEEHPAIPAGRTPGAAGEKKFVLKQRREFYHPSKGNVMRFPKIKITSRVDALCGRMKKKKNIHNEAQSLL